MLEVLANVELVIVGIPGAVGIYAAVALGLFPAALVPYSVMVALLAKFKPLFEMVIVSDPLVNDDDVVML
jgi:uncharacterized membrane protein YbhN (UPF0104 family)